MRRMTILKKIADINSDDGAPTKIENVDNATLICFCGEDDVNASLTIPKANANGTYQVMVNDHIYELNFIKEAGTVDVSVISGSATVNVQIYKLG